MGSFAHLARYLQHPLTLIGFGLFLLFGLFKTVINAKIIPTLSIEGGTQVLDHLLFYGFVLVFCLIFLGMALQFYKIARGTISPREVKAHQEQLTAQNEQLMLGQKHLAAQNDQLREILLPVAKALEDQKAGLTAQNQRQRATAILQEAGTLIASIGQRMTPENFVYVGFANWLAGDFETAIQCLKQGLEEGVGEALERRAREVLASLIQIQANEAIRRGASSHAS